MKSKISKLHVARPRECNCATFVFGSATGDATLTKLEAVTAWTLSSRDRVRSATGVQLAAPIGCNFSLPGIRRSCFL